MGVADLDAFLNEPDQPKGVAALDAFLASPSAGGGARPTPASPSPAPVAAPERSWYQSVAQPVTRAVSALADVVTEPLVSAERIRSGEPVSQVLTSGTPLTDPKRFTAPINPIATAVVPQTPLEAGAMIGTGAAAPVAKAIPALGKLAAGHPALTRIFGGAAGGEVGGQAEGRSAGTGAALGGGMAALGEVLGKGVEYGRRSLPGAKKAISLEDTRRVGADIADVTGAPVMRTPGDVLDEATGAFARRGGIDSANEAAMATHRQAVAEARAKAAQATRDGRADRAAEWQRRQQEHQATVTRLETEAREATARAKQEAAAAAERTNAGLRTRAASEIHSVINRVAPQLSAALGTPDAASLRAAGAGGARRVLGEGKEAVTRQLEEAAPDGILVPAISEQPISVRDALWALSEVGAGRGTQFARNPLDRDILGAVSRTSYGNIADQIRKGLNAVRPGLGDVFQQGQQVYREGLAVSKTLLEPDKNWLPTGEVNIGRVASDLVKPRARRVIEDKLGPERYQEIAGAVTRLPREAVAHPVPRIEPVLPAPPQKPLGVARVSPDLPPEPTLATPTPADRVMTALFGPQTRVQQGRDTLVNWPEVQKAVQSPAARAELEAAVGPAGYQRILRSVLRGATEGADVPAAGSGRLGGPILDWLAGREKGAGFAASMIPRAALPNMGAHYVGKQQPMQLPPALQSILDIALQRAGGEAFDQR